MTRNVYEYIRVIVICAVKLARFEIHQKFVRNTEIALKCVRLRNNMCLAKKKKKQRNL